jgi:PAS domain S-box-containing protein
MLLVDGSGAIQRANPVAEHMLGFADGELSGIQVDTLVPESVRPAHAQNRAGYMQKPENRHMGEGRELFAVRKDGTQLPVEIALSPANDESEPMVLCSIVDIELRKQAQDGLSSYADRLKRSNEELEQFAYVVSHDIKAPLRGIASVSEWIAEDLADSASAETKENLALLLDRTERLAALIDGILRYSRVGRLESTRHPVDVGQLLQDVRDSLDPPKSIEVRLHGPFPTVTYDATQLRQVFQNLIDNAIKHMDREAGHIDVTCVEGPVYWTFGVKDDGPGIPERHFERIFGLFQTLKPKDDTRSVGLGLAISKRIVTLNGGTIHVQSEVDAGSEFSFTVPRDLTGKPKKPQRVSTS